MYLTLETDYAVRIIDVLARNNARMGAKSIAEQTHVTLRFSLKILRKLVANKLIKSYKGSQGGYEIARPLDAITLNDVLVAIEGPFTINRCLGRDAVCIHAMEAKAGNCPYHALFKKISDQVTTQLREVTFAQVLSEEDA